jgi:hypothetical protein
MKAFAYWYKMTSSTMKTSKINYSFILTHFLASVLLMFGLRQFAFLTEFNVMRNLHDYGIHDLVRYTSAHDMMNMFESLFIATILGFQVSMIISLMIMLKRRIALVNALIVFVLAFILLVFIYFYKFESLLYTRNSAVSMFYGSWLSFKYIMPGMGAIILALFGFFNPWTNKASGSQQVQYS